MPKKTIEHQSRKVPLFEAESILPELPKATLHDAFADDGTGRMVALPNRKAVFVNGEPSGAVVSASHYELVDFDAAFRPVLRGLIGASSPVSVQFVWAKDRAAMRVYLEQEVYDSVKIGFSASTSHDGKSALRYDSSMTKKQFSKHWEERSVSTEVKDDGQPFAMPKHEGGYTFLEFQAFREICSNKMTVRIPLAEALEQAGNPKISIKKMLTEVWSEESERVKVLTLLARTNRFAHVGAVSTKILSQANMVALTVAMQAPVKRIIQRAMAKKLTDEEITRIIKGNLSKVLADKVLEAPRENNTLWAVVNQLSWTSTHAMENATDRTRIENAAADVLLTMEVPPASVLQPRTRGSRGASPAPLQRGV